MLLLESTVLSVGHPSKAKFGADNRVRTDDLLVGNQMLYQLSYIRTNLATRRGFDPLTSAVTVLCSPNWANEPYNLVEDFPSPSPSPGAPRATSTCLVDQRGIEPRPMPCKGIVLPLSLSAHKLSNLKLLYQKLRLLCSLLGKTNLVLTTGFEPATGFLLRITKPVLSAIQPSQHKIGPAVGSLTQDISARSCRPSLSTTGRRPRVDDSIKLVAGEGLEPP